MVIWRLYIKNAGWLPSTSSLHFLMTLELKEAETEDDFDLRKLMNRGWQPPT